MEVFDVFFKKFSDITQEPIQQGFKKTFPRVQMIILMKKYVFLEKVSIVFFFQAPSEIFFLLSWRKLSVKIVKTASYVSKLTFWDFLIK